MYPRTIYLAGRYTALKPDGSFDLPMVRAHIETAKEWGRWAARAGAMPFIPHANTDESYLHIQSARFWYAGTMLLLEAADGVLMLPGWELSVGAKKELARAKDLGKHVFYCDDPKSLDDFDVWARAI